MIIDQSVLLEWLKNQQKADECEQILDACAAGDRTGYIIDFHINGTRAVLGYGSSKPDEKIRQFENRLASGIGIERCVLSHRDIHGACAILRDPESTLDFDDSCVVQAALELDTPIVAKDDDFWINNHEDRYGYRHISVDDYVSML
ncbi:MAG: PIN domain-containing protein [Halovenus sp.]